MGTRLDLEIWHPHVQVQMRLLNLPFCFGQSDFANARYLHNISVELCKMYFVRRQSLKREIAASGGDQF